MQYNTFLSGGGSCWPVKKSGEQSMKGRLLGKIMSKFTCQTEEGRNYACIKASEKERGTGANLQSKSTGGKGETE